MSRGFSSNRHTRRLECAKCGNKPAVLVLAPTRDADEFWCESCADRHETSFPSWGGNDARLDRRDPT